MDGTRKQSIVYSPATGRIAESDGFRWTYLPGTNLKSSLTYRTNDVVTWSYEPHRDLLTAVTNATYSTYVYTNDLLGRRTSKNNEQYGYNVRNELIAADNVSYNYDDIGNRITAEGKTYTANNLNQYTAIDDFTPQYDADGNQTLIKTSTGIWSVQYNAENRPIRWQSGDTVITMSFDCMGRRVEMRTQSVSSDLLQRFVYDNYLCIQQLRTPSNTLFHSYVWDPTEPIATRPLTFIPSVGEIAYYFHDGNKNVSDLVDAQGNIVHYSYTPFGTPTASAPSENPFGFSFEFYDGRLDLVYYNYRHYISKLGRWCVRDPLGEKESVNLFSTQNNPTTQTDYLGQSVVTTTITAAAVALFVNKCIKPAYYEGSLNYGERTDKFRHCWTSCAISRRCGGQMAQFAGLGKEAWDSAVRLAIQMGWTEDGGRGTGNWADSFYDWVANNTCIGIESYFGLPAAWIGGAVRESCECCCEREYK